MISLSYPIILVVQVLGTALVAWFFGALWHGPLFGKLWMKLANMTMDDAEKERSKIMRTLFLAYIGQCITAFALMAALSVTTMMSQSLLTIGLTLLMIWLGFMVPILFNGYLWEKKSLQLFAFNAVYQFMVLIVMTLALVGLSQVFVIA